jgi:glycosyltransferase involved in cell wall biosynthesis
MLENKNTVFDKKSLPLVSVVIPTYNRPKLVGNAIESVLAQTFQNFEIIVVDDSTDNETEMVVKNFNNAKIKYIRVEDIQKGSAAARKKNIGVRNSSPDSKYIAFLDDDDEWLPRYLEVVIEELEKDKSLTGVIPQGISKLRDGTILKRRILKPSEFRFWKHGVGNCWTLRKEIFIKENIWYDENDIFEDLDFVLKLKDHKLKIIPQILWISYPLPQTKGASSSTKFERQADNIPYFFQKHFETYKKAGKEALSFLYYFTGKIYCQAGRIKEGRKHLREAFKIYPTLEHFLYYTASLFFPQIFQSYKLQFWKHKLLGK